MLFWKIDEETIRCLINKDEIINMGYDLAEISEDADQMEAFLESIVQNSRDYIEWDTENGIQNYMARALPADQFLITISCTFQDEVIDRNLDQIRKMTEALHNRITEERLDRIEALSGEEKEKAFMDLSKDLYAVCNGDLDGDGQEGGGDSGTMPAVDTSGRTDDRTAPVMSGPVAGLTKENGKGKQDGQSNVLPQRMLVFNNLDDLITFAGMLREELMYESALYKSDDRYVLLVSFDRCRKDADAVAFVLRAEEYGGECSPVRYDQAYMMEHGQVLIKEEALKVLASL